MQFILRICLHGFTAAGMRMSHSWRRSVARDHRAAAERQPKMHASRFSAARARAQYCPRRGRYKTSNATPIVSIRARSPRSALDRLVSVVLLIYRGLSSESPFRIRLIIAIPIYDCISLSLSLSLSFFLSFSFSREFNSLATLINVFIISLITQT